MSIFAVLDPMRNSRAQKRKRKEARRKQLLFGSIAVVWFLLIFGVCIGGMIGLCYWLGML